MQATTQGKLFARANPLGDQFKDGVSKGRTWCCLLPRPIYVRPLVEGGLASLLRLSVLYQPLPLKTMAVGVISRRGVLPQAGHAFTGSSSKRCTKEKTCWHVSQR